MVCRTKLFCITGWVLKRWHTRCVCHRKRDQWFQDGSSRQATALKLPAFTVSILNRTSRFLSSIARICFVRASILSTIGWSTSWAKFQKKEGWRVWRNDSIRAARAASLRIFWYLSASRILICRLRTVACACRIYQRRLRKNRRILVTITC